MIISLDGPDNVGKTANIRWLLRALPEAVNLGAVHEHDPNWQTITGHDLARWWFEKSTTKEHVHVLFGGHRARCAKIESAPVYFLDRGPSMVAATCAATMAIKERVDPLRALEYVRRLSQRLSPDLRNLVQILLIPSLSPEETTRFSLENEKSTISDRYCKYQRLLTEVVLDQVRHHVYDHVVFIKDRTKIDVQNELREIISARMGLKLRILGESIERIWAIGGMTESGKSTVGEIMREGFNICRLKMDYLVGLGAIRANTTKDELYGRDDEDLAERMFIELDEFARAHPFIQEFSIESVHRFRVARHLKGMLGSRLQIVYVDVPLGTRIQRSASPRALLIEKDRTKKGRGADEVRTIADWVVNNESNRITLRNSVATMIQNCSIWIRPAVAALSKVKLPSKEREWIAKFTSIARGSLGDNLQLVAVTGSASTGGWRSGWSDLDLLVVVKDFDGAKWKHVWNQVDSELRETRVGLTVLTLPEIRSGLIGGHIVHKLRLFATTDLAAAYCAPSFTLPIRRREEDVRASLTDLPFAVGVLRRLIIQNAKAPRPLYKSAVLVAKIALRVEGINTEKSADTLVRFSQRFCGGTLKFPRLSAIGGSRDEATVRLVRACSDLLHVYDSWLTGLAPK